QLATPACRVGGDLDDAGLAKTEDNSSLELGGRVVEVHNGARRIAQAFEGPLHQLAAALRQHLHGDVLRDQILFDQQTNEVVIGLRCRRKTDLDLFEANSEQDLPEAALA